MDRRGFLGALVGLAAAPLLPKLPRGFALSPAGVIVPEAPGFVLATLERAALLVGVQVYGMETISRLATLNICRPNGSSLLRFDYNEAGGVVLWRSMAHEGIFCDKSAPLVIDIAGAGTDLHLEYYNFDDNRLHILEYRTGQAVAGPWQIVKELTFDAPPRWLS